MVKLLKHVLPNAPELLKYANVLNCCYDAYFDCVPSVHDTSHVVTRCNIDSETQRLLMSRLL